MARRFWMSPLFVAVLMLTSCQQAQRYATAPKKAEAKPEVKDESPDRGPHWFTWKEPRGAGRDTPIVFVSESNPEWSDLKDFWNVFPHPVAWTLVHASQANRDPLSALSALVVLDAGATVRIKVPRGLPDPTKHIPPLNRPSVRKWELGKALFHERLLPAGRKQFACATCHRPELGFQDTEKHGNFRTLSLINVVYNRRQFWDGRVESLEETLVRGLAENQLQSEEKTLQQHNFPGFVSELAAKKRYNQAFVEVFGVEHPTQDTVAQALATYMRTILSGDSLYDRAIVERRKDKKATAFKEDHFLEPLKDEKLLKSFQDEKKYTREQLASLLVKGEQVFRNKDKGRCVVCHSGPLFTDGDYHNVGYKGAEGEPDVGVETGRAAHVPIGHKQSRLIGAFRTPSLRLSGLAPYFHDGSFFRLDEVVEFFDYKIVDTSHLAAPLKKGDEPIHLDLKKDEKEALVLFLRSLEGAPAAPIVTEAPR